MVKIPIHAASQIHDGASFGVFGVEIEIQTPIVKIGFSLTESRNQTCAQFSAVLLKSLLQCGKPLTSLQIHGASLPLSFLGTRRPEFANPL